MLNVRVTVGHRPAQAQEEPAGRDRGRRERGGERLFPFLSGVTEFFCKLDSIFFNCRVLAGGVVIRCTKKS